MKDVNADSALIIYKLRPIYSVSSLIKQCSAFGFSKTRNLFQITVSEFFFFCI